MTRGPIETLTALRSQLVDGLATRLVDRDTPLHELQETGERLRLIDIALGGSAAGAPRARRSTWFALVCVGAVVTVLAVLPRAAAPFSLDTVSSSIAFELSEAASLSPQSIGGPVVAEGFDSVVSGDTALVSTSVNDLVAEADELTLRRIITPARSTIRVTVSDGRVELAIDATEGEIHVELGLRGASNITLGEQAVARTYGTAEWIELKSSGSSGRAPRPIHIRFARLKNKELTWNGLLPSHIRFTERRADSAAGTQVASSLESGKLTLPATAKAVSLVVGDALELDGIVAGRAQIKVGSTVRTLVGGTATQLYQRTGGFTVSHVPSVLEYWAKNSTATLMWSAAGVLWGVLTWLRKH